MPSIARGLSKYLRLDSELNTAVGGRIYPEELPRTENKQMPRPAIVLGMAPGGGAFGKVNNFGDRMVDVMVYGQSLAEARNIYDDLVRPRLKNLQRVVVADSDDTAILIHWAHIASDGSTGRDPSTDWPVCGSTWQVLAAEVPA